MGSFKLNFKSVRSTSGDLLYRQLWELQIVSPNLPFLIMNDWEPNVLKEIRNCGLNIVKQGGWISVICSILHIKCGFGVFFPHYFSFSSYISEYTLKTKTLKICSIVGNCLKESVISLSSWCSSQPFRS